MKRTHRAEGAQVQRKTLHRIIIAAVLMPYSAFELPAPAIARVLQAAADDLRRGWAMGGLERSVT